jgi:hypothetical protein
LLKTYTVQISMAAKGQLEENGYAERLMRTIKEEEIDLSEYNNFANTVPRSDAFSKMYIWRNRPIRCWGIWHRLSLRPPGGSCQSSGSDHPLRITEKLSSFKGPLHSVFASIHLNRGLPIALRHDKQGTNQ